MSKNKEKTTKDDRSERVMLSMHPETRRKLRMVAALRDTSMIDAVAQMADEELARKGIPSRSEGDAQG